MATLRQRARCVLFYLIFFPKTLVCAPALDTLSAACSLALSEASGELTGQELFELAHKLEALDHPEGEKVGKKYLLKNRSAADREKILNSFADLLAKYIRVTKAQNEKELISILQGGNVPHIEDHLRMVEAFAEDYAKVFGVDPLSLKVWTLAHDLGKARMSKALQDYLVQELDGNREGQLDGTPGIEVVNKFVMNHNLHTHAYALPEVMKELAKLHNLGPEEVADLMGQVTYNNAYHNFGPLHVDPRLPKEEALKKLAARYPTLTPKELEYVRNAFWPKFYGNGVTIPGKDAPVRLIGSFGGRLGVSRIYGQPKSPMGRSGTLNDRVTLVTDGAMEKIPKQNLSRTGFNRKLIEETFLDGGDAIGPSTAALVKAQYAELRQGNSSISADPTTFRPARYGFHVAERATEFGNRLMKMNSDEAFARHGIEGAEKDQIMLYHAKDGTVFKVDGGVAKDGKFPTAKLSIWESSKSGKGGDWVAVEDMAFLPSTTTANPKAREGWDVMLDLARRDGFRIPTPAEFIKSESR